jgi:hypothetical protein
MSGPTPTIHDSTGSDIGSATYVAFRVESRAQAPQDRAWAEFNAAMRTGLVVAGFPQSDELLDEREPPVGDLWRLVAPGMILRAQEYEDRYGGVALDDLRVRMEPGLFNTYVRYIGILAGQDGVDVNQLVEEQAE